MSATHVGLPSDEEILSGCRAGRELSWKAFVDRFSGLVYWSAGKYLEGYSLSDREDFCREIFQEFFAKLIEKRLLENLKEASKIRKFIVVSVTRLAQDKLRQRNRISTRYRPLDETLDVGTDMDTSLDEPKIERLALLTDILGELSPKERAILDLCYESGMTHVDIAILLGLPQDTVSTVIRRAKEKIKKKMTEKVL